jgi:Fic family protein
LIEQVWGYQYEALRHDTLVYAMARQIRKSLGTHSEWLVATEEGYSFKAKIVILKSVTPTAQDLEFAEEALPVDQMLTDLNYRQNQAISYLRKNPFINVKIYQSLFKTSGLTASRDLSSLKEKGYVVRLGCARLTRYVMNQKLNRSMEAFQ